MVSIFKRSFIGLLVLGSLAACDKEQVEVAKQEKEEKQEIQKEKNTVDSTNDLNLSSYAAKYHIYGGWITDNSYIIIANGDEEKILENMVKKNEKKEIIHFKLAESSSPTKLTALLSGNEVENEQSFFNVEVNSFFTIELNEEHNELTIKMPNQKPVTYKKATMDPDEFNPEFVWGES